MPRYIQYIGAFIIFGGERGRLSKIKKTKLNQIVKNRSFCQSLSKVSYQARYSNNKFLCCEYASYL